MSTTHSAFTLTRFNSGVVNALLQGAPERMKGNAWFIRLDAALRRIAEEVEFEHKTVLERRTYQLKGGVEDLADKYADALREQIDTLEVLRSERLAHRKRLQSLEAECVRLRMRSLLDKREKCSDTGRPLRAEPEIARHSLSADSTTQTTPNLRTCSSAGQEESVVVGESVVVVSMKQELTPTDSETAQPFTPLSLPAGHSDECVQSEAARSPAGLLGSPGSTAVRNCPLPAEYDEPRSRNPWASILSDHGKMDSSSLDANSSPTIVPFSSSEVSRLKSRDRLQLRFAPPSLLDRLAEMSSRLGSAGWESLFKSGLGAYPLLARAPAEFRPVLLLCRPYLKLDSEGLVTFKSWMKLKRSIDWLTKETTGLIPEGLLPSQST